jgi:hypothetical protein
MRIELMLIASEDAEVASVSTTLDIDLRSRHWASDLVAAVTAQAHEGGRRLRDQLLDRALLAATGEDEPEFVPLTMLVAPATARE